MSNVYVDFDWRIWRQVMEDRNLVVNALKFRGCKVYLIITYGRN